MAERQYVSYNDQPAYDESAAIYRRGYYVITEPREGSWAFPPHYHTDIGIFGIPGGFSETVTVDGKHHPVAHPTVFLLPPMVIYSFSLYCAGIRRFPIIKISSETIVSSLSTVSGQKPSRMRERLSRLAPGILPRSNIRLTETARKPSGFHDRRLGLEHPYLPQTLQATASDASGLFEIPPPLLARAEGAADSPRSPTEPVRRAMGVTEKRFAENLSLADIAAASFVSKFHMCLSKQGLSKQGRGDCERHVDRGLVLPISRRQIAMEKRVRGSRCPDAGILSACACVLLLLSGSASAIKQGAILAIQSGQDEWTQGNLLLVTVPSNAKKTLMGGSCGCPCFPPDGRTVAVIRDGTIATVNIDGSNVQSSGITVAINGGRGPCNHQTLYQEGGSYAYHKSISYRFGSSIG